MTQPWNPSPNPGGQNRRLMREALSGWIEAQHILGLQRVWESPRGYTRVDWEAVAVGVSEARCQGIVNIPRARESRVAGTGPVDRGGKAAHYDVELELHYLSAQPRDWPAAIVDFERIVDAIKDALRGPGRDLGRPDVVLQVGEWPATDSITDQVDDPIDIEGGTYITATIYFTASQYMQQQTQGA